jgi:hypothetical protein
MVGDQREEFTLFGMRTREGYGWPVSGGEAYKGHEGPQNIFESGKCLIGVNKDPLEKVVVIPWIAG